MNTFLEATTDPALVGFDAGWKIELRAAGADGAPTDNGMISISRNDYAATVKVERTASFRAPSFDIVIDGLSDQHHNLIVGTPHVFVKILLGWRDIGGGAAAPFKDVGALFSGSGGPDGNYREVIHGRLHSYERLHGEFRYRTHLTGIDRHFHRMRYTTAKAPEVRPGDPVIRYAELLAQQVSVPIIKHPPIGPYEPIDEVIEIPAKARITQALQQIARAAHGGDVGRQVPLYMGIDGLHVGPWAAPSTANHMETKRIEMRNGLVEVKPVVANDPNDCVDPFGVPTILRFDLMLRGRADLEVGNLVELEVDVPSPGTLPPTIASSVLGGVGDVVSGVASAFGRPPEPRYTSFRIVSVKHELDRARGFVTSARVERQRADEGDATGAEAEPHTRVLDEAARTAVVLAAQSRAERHELLTLDVAHIVAQSSYVQDIDGRTFGPQRLELNSGLTRSGQSNAGVTDAAATIPTRLFNKPYLTPFAFGQTGLIIPHYPGTRVVDLHYRDDVRNAIVAGCIWPDGTEPRSKYGDYWLSLPIGYHPAERDDTPSDAAPPSGPAVHDLIDIDGGRALHVRGFRISIGEGKLVDAGSRPTNAASDELLIEHKSGARIRIDAEGNITISTTKDLTIDARKITMNVTDKVEVVK